MRRKPGRSGEATGVTLRKAGRVAREVAQRGKTGVARLGSAGMVLADFQVAGGFDPNHESGGLRTPGDHTNKV